MACVSQPLGRAGLTPKGQLRVWKSKRLTCLGRPGCEQGLSILLQGRGSLSISQHRLPGVLPGLSILSEAGDQRLEQPQRFSARQQALAVSQAASLGTQHIEQEFQEKKTPGEGGTLQ